MVNETEAFLLWAVPTWEQWGSWKRPSAAHGQAARLAPRRRTARPTRFHRFLLVDAPLSPFRTGRQPLVSDRHPAGRSSRQDQSAGSGRTGFVAFMQDKIDPW